MESRLLRDSGWVGSMFFNMPVSARDTRFNALKVYSNSMLSFADTTIGGNQAINAPPQFTMFADPPMLGALANPRSDRPKTEQEAWMDKFDQRGSYRMGQFYWDSIESNAHYVHMRFGKPRYLGMAAFFANMYDSKVAYMARTGDYPNLIRVSAMYFTAAAVCAAVGPFAFIAILTIPKMLGTMLNSTSSKYWYLKPTMHFYLRCVQTMINTQLVHRRLTHTGLFGVLKRSGDIDNENNKYYNDKEDLYKMLPEVWRPNGSFDIYRMINRYQTLANYQHETLQKLQEDYLARGDVDGLDAAIVNFYTKATYSEGVLGDVERERAYGLEEMELVFANSKGYKTEWDEEDAMNDYLLDQVSGIYKDAGDAGGTSEDFLTESQKKNAELQQQIERNRSAANKMNGEGDTQIDDSQIQAYMDGGQSKTVGDLFGSFAEGLKDGIDSLKLNIGQYAKDELAQGSQWITWRIDSKDTVSRSFSNSTKEPEVSSMVNAATQKARSLEVNLSGGKTGFDPVDAVVTGVKSALTGALDFLHLSGIVSLYNQSVINFPEVWDSSDASGDDMTINIPLRCWSGNDLDVIQDLIIPICFWVGAVVPIATGKQSHTHPFYCELYSRGRLSMQNAMVTNLSIQFGTGGLGWRNDGVPLGADLSVTVRDLNRRYFMPLVNDASVWDEDNKFSEFMSVLGAATLQERTNRISMKAVDLASWKLSYLSGWSVSSISNTIGNLPPARVLSNILSSRTY